MTTRRHDLLVGPDWLAERLGDPDIAIVDASWYLPSHGRNARQEYLVHHIPGAVFFDIDAISDRTSPLPHMLPTADDFADAVGAMGITRKTTIICYDGMVLFSAPRVWWSFRVFGAEDVRILDGGLPAWKAKGLPLTDAVPSPAPRRFEARFDASLVADMERMRGAIGGGDQIVDARPKGRFDGTDPEIRPGLESGHMPGAATVPQASLVRDGRLLPDAELLAAFARAGIDPDQPVITTCGSGVSASTLTLALAVLGKPLGALYDGSWTEWAGTPGNPIEKSPDALRA